MKKRMAGIFSAMMFSMIVGSQLTGPVFADTTSDTAIGLAGGVQNGVLTQTGTTPEQWTQNPQIISMNSLNHDASSNQLALSGQVANNYQGDIVVEIMAKNHGATQYVPSSWAYSVQVTNGSFAATIELPYHGENDIYVGIPDTSNGNIGISAGYASLQANNNQPSLTAQQMGLLQSWAVNYNETTAFSQLATKITANAKTTYDKIKLVSDWVSANVAYNWTELNSGVVTWQQASETVSSRVGVCQDESFLVAALLRSINVPTQPLCGEGVTSTGNEPHEWVQSWDGQRWVTYDPTWDQVYAQTNKVSLPVTVNHTYFDAPRRVFSQSHKAQQVDTW